MERKWPRYGASLSRTAARSQLRQYRSSQARRFHENFLVATGGKKRARTFNDFPGNGKSPRRSVRSLLVEQCSVGLRREERAAKQNRVRTLFASRNADQSGANHYRALC